MENELEKASCEGKVSFDTWSLAYTVAKRRGSNGKKGGVYRCRFCHKFHIGRSSKHRRRLMHGEQTEY